MPHKKTAVLTSSLTSLKEIKSKHKSMNEDEQALYRRALEIYRGDTRAIIDAAAELDASERKAYVDPYVELARALKKRFKPTSRAFTPAPFGAMKRVARNFDVFTAWLKNRHYYKPDELHPPATDKDLHALQSYLRRAMNKPDYQLPPALVDSYRICDGVSDQLRMHPDTGLRLFTLKEIRAEHAEVVSRYKRAYLVPVSDDGAGNLRALWGDEVYDLNHEDGGCVAIAPSLGKLLSKAHKPQR